MSDDELEFFSENLPEKNILDYICKTRKIPIVKHENDNAIPLTRTEIINELAQAHKNDSFLFCETTGVPKELLDRLNNEQWKKILNDFLYEGIEKDKRIELIYKSDLVRVNPQIIKPRHYQPYNSHELIFTNSKVTKTSTAMKTGIVVERASPSNLLGFSTAQDIVQGSLDNETKTITVDEIQEEKVDEAYSKLSNYLELGETETRVGKAIVKVKGYAGLRWQGNPKERTIDIKEKITDYLEQEIYQLFSDCLRAISKNNEAFGGRISTIVFASNFKNVDTKNKLNLNENEENSAIVGTVLDACSDKFSNLFMDSSIENWLNKGYNQSYTQALEKIENACKLESIKNFISGHRRLAHKHVRGKAFKLALVDKALEIFKTNTKLNELLELAEEYLKQIEELNLNSFSELVDVASKESTIKQYLKTSFQELPNHLQVLLEATRNYLKEHTDATNFLLGELEILYSEVESKKTTRSTAEITARITKRFDKTNNAIEKFGVLLTGDEQEPHIFIKDTTRLNSIWSED